MMPRMGRESFDQNASRMWSGAMVTKRASGMSFSHCARLLSSSGSFGAV